MSKPSFCFFFFLCLFLKDLRASQDAAYGLPPQPVYKDTAYLQDYSIKYLVDQVKGPNGLLLRKVYCDRNGIVQVYSSEGILKKSGGQFLIPGKLVPDVSYLPIVDKKIKSIGLYQNQFVYTDDTAVLSNAWAGRLYCLHTMPDVTMFCGGEDFSFLLSDGTLIRYLKDSKLLWESRAEDKLIKPFHGWCFAVSCVG